MPKHGAGKRYAEAVFELAARDGAFDEWRKDLATACVVAADERASRAIDSPAVPFARRRDAIEQLLGKRVSPKMLNLALALAAHGRFALLPEVSADFDELVRRSRGISSATVTTPTPLSEAELVAVKARVEQIAGGAVELTTATDPSLVGGLRVMIGDLQIDASVSTRLARLRKQLVQGPS